MDIETLNKTQAAWMALDCYDPEEEKQRVYSLMRQQPGCHLVIPLGAPDTANINWGGPVWSEPQPMRYALEYAEKHGIQTDFAWRTDGQWVAVRKEGV
jgi:hypothetical protein